MGAHVTIEYDAMAKEDKEHESPELISLNLRDHNHTKRTFLKFLALPIFYPFKTKPRNNNTPVVTYQPSQGVVLKHFWTQWAKTITVQPGPSCSILPGRHIKAAILNHVSRRTSNDYWAPAYFNINSLEAGIGGSEEGVKSAAAGRILGALWLRPLCFIEAIFQCLLWQHLRLLNCGLQGKSEGGREKVGGKERKRERDHRSKKRGKDRWRLERERKND